MHIPSDKIWIEVSQILRGPVDAEGEADDALLDLQDDRFIRPNGPISYQIHVELAGKDLIASGSASAPLQLLCGRCGSFFSTNVKIPSFLRAYDWDEYPEVLDLTGDIREDLLLEVPPYPLCRPDCRGLCPQCGQNLNVAPCDCPPPPAWEADAAAASPWDALDGLGLEEPPKDGPSRNKQ